MYHRVYFIFTLFASYHLPLHCSLSASKDILEARCSSRCYSKVPHGKECTKSLECLSCLRPCQTKQQGLPCFIICGPNVMNATTCRKSCTFIKHLELEDKNSSCPPQVSRNECNLMAPEDVQIVETTGIVPGPPAVNITINGSWPSSTVFVIRMQEMKEKLPKREKDLPLWMTENYYLTTSRSLVIKLQSMHWYRFKVAAANQYGITTFSGPSDFYYAKPQKPESPWNFQVQFMQVNEGTAEVSLSWKKPKRMDLPIHRYKLGWSKRLDRPSDDFKLIPFEIVRIQGNAHTYKIIGLQLNTTYVLELQAVCRVGRKRLRSKWVYLTIRTPVSEKDKKNKKWTDKKPITNNQSGSKAPPVMKGTVQTTQGTYYSQSSAPLSGGTNYSQSSAPPSRDTPNVVKQTGSATISRSPSCVLLVLSTSIALIPILVLWHPI